MTTFGQISYQGLYLDGVNIPCWSNSIIRLLTVSFCLNLAVVFLNFTHCFHLSNAVDLPRVPGRVRQVVSQAPPGVPGHARRVVSQAPSLAPGALFSAPVACSPSSLQNLHTHKRCSHMFSPLLVPLPGAPFTQQLPLSHRAELALLPCPTLCPVLDLMVPSLSHL